MTTIKVKINHCYGTRRIIPECETGKTLAAIAGTKTLTDETIRLARLIGYNFETSAETI